MYTTRDADRRKRDRAASEIVGLILLFGIVIAGAGLIFWTGMDARDSVQSASEIDTAETSLEEASSKLSTLSFRGDGATTTFDLSGQDANDVSIEQQGTISFQLNGNANCRSELDLGSIVYENDDGTTVAYQAGGVFKKSSGGVSIVQSPDLSYEVKEIDGRDVNTISFPVVNVSGEVSSSGTVTARANESSNDLNDDLCLTGPNTDEIEYVREIKVTVEGSPYYEAWERFFRDEFGSQGTITVDDGAQKVSVVAPLGSGVHPNQFDVDNKEILGAIFAGSSSGEINLQNKHSVVDSYDSTDGPWGGEPSYGSNGTIVTRGDVRVVAAGATVAGNVYSEGTIKLKKACTNNPGGRDISGGDENYCIDGDAYMNNSSSAGFDVTGTGLEEAISGETGNGTFVPDIPTMDDVIEANGRTIRENNHNDKANDISGNQLQFSGSGAELTSGVYHLDDLTVPSGETLELNTTDGDIVIAVEDPVDIESSATVNVSGDGQVRVFINDSTSSGKQVRIGSSATVKISDSSQRSYNSEQLFLVCKSGCSATLDDGTEFTGVIYGPGEESDSGTINLKDVDVWGALVAGTVNFGNNAEFHFDTSLQTDTFSSYGSTPGDSDDDGIPDDEDDCPNSAGTGENGCAGVTKDESENVLVVNQSSATITVLGSQIADEQIVNSTTETRAPVTVELVMDDSGSMNLFENEGSYYYENGAHTTGEWSSWSSWEQVDDASYVDSYGTYSPPEGVEWEVKYETWYGTTDTEIIHSWEDHTFSADDEVRRRTMEDDSIITVPENTVYVGDDDAESGCYYCDPIDWGSGTQVYYPGESFDASEHPYYHEISIPGNDVFWDRLDAGKRFVGAMSEKDLVGLVRFDGEIHEMETLTNEYDQINDSLARQHWNSTGATDLNTSLATGIDNVKASDDERDGMNVTKAIVLMTDGQHSDDEPGNASTIMDLADEAHENGIRIYVVALGDEGNYNESLLEYIANEEGDPDVQGKLYQVENAGDLSDKFQAVANDTKRDKVRVIQHKNTTTKVHMGGDTVTLGSNTNAPGMNYPTYTVDSNLEAGNEVHFESFTSKCADDETFNQTYNATFGEYFNETTCDGTTGMANRTTNADHSAHQLFVDGDPVPAVGDGAWYKTESFQDIVTGYNSSFIQGGTFNLPANDAIILVNISDGEAADTDFMVLYFDAHDTPTPDYDDGTDDDSEDDEFEPSDSGTENGYVVDVSSGEVNVSTSVVPTAPMASVTSASTSTFSNTASSGSGTTPAARPHESTAN